MAYHLRTSPCAGCDRATVEQLLHQDASTKHHHHCLKYGTPRRSSDPLFSASRSRLGRSTSCSGPSLATTARANKHAFQFAIIVDHASARRSPGAGRGPRGGCGAKSDAVQTSCTVSAKGTESRSSWLRLWLSTGRYRTDERTRCVSLSLEPYISLVCHFTLSFIQRDAPPNSLQHVYLGGIAGCIREQVQKTRQFTLVFFVELPRRVLSGLGTEWTVTPLECLVSHQRQFEAVMHIASAKNTPAFLPSLLGNVVMPTTLARSTSAASSDTSDGTKQSSKRGHRTKKKKRGEPVSGPMDKFLAAATSYQQPVAASATTTPSSATALSSERSRRTTETPSMNSVICIDIDDEKTPSASSTNSAVVTQASKNKAPSSASSSLFLSSVDMLAAAVVPAGSQHLPPDYFTTTSQTMFRRLNPLNQSQETAARKFLESEPNTITLIQGPPGTGTLSMRWSRTPVEKSIVSVRSPSPYCTDRQDDAFSFHHVSIHFREYKQEHRSSFIGMRTDQQGCECLGDAFLGRHGSGR